jgi:DNA/RNA endonuclease YhcR with UshA esterase domain
MKALAVAMAVTLAGLMASASPALAHHAVQAVFDVNKPVTVSGSITKVEWINPHSYISLDSKDNKGNVQHWVFELAGPGALRQAGLSREDGGGLKPGDIVKIEGIAAKDGTTTGFLNKLYFPDGRVFVLANKDPYAR